MSETKETASTPAPPTPPRGPESQHERWLKYGGNVVLATVVVILLAAGVTWIATRYRLRRDTTEAGLYGLKPQTKAVVHDLKQPVEIVSLYSRPDSTPRRDKREEAERVEQESRADRVADLLDEYERNSAGKITVDVIDPDKQTGKVDALIDKVTAKYGGEVKKYQDFLDDYKKNQFEQLKKLVADAAAQVPATPFNEENTPEAIRLANQTVPDISAQLDKQREQYNKLLNQRPPNYKGATDAIEQGMDVLSQISARIVEDFKASKDDQKVPEPLRKYLTDSIPRFEAIKKAADDIKGRIAKLGELKLDELRQKLRERDAILVMGPKDMRTLSANDVWQTDPNVRRMLSSSNGEIKPRFAGEQQVTSAVLALTAEKKPKVAFVRSGGPPLAQAGNPFMGPGGPLSTIADRLREYNFEVVEKDLSGMWAVQQQMQQRGMPPTPEPTDEEIKDAIWIAVSIPSGPTPTGNADMAPKLAEHLKNGASALVLVEPEGDALSSALNEWGVSVRSNAMVVHETVQTSEAGAADWINQAQRMPQIFILNSYGNHLLAKPLAGLDFLSAGAAPVEFSPKQGYEGTSLLPVPTALQTWGETSLASLGQEDPKFDPKSDLSPPFNLAAAVEKKGGGRLVVLGSAQAAINQILQIPDRDLLQQYRVLTSRFPGNGEFLTNSVLWLAKMEPMIAISPAANNVSRISDVGPGALTTWRTVLMAGLPLAVVLAGLAMFIRRRG